MHRGKHCHSRISVPRVRRERSRPRIPLRWLFSIVVLYLFAFPFYCIMMKVVILTATIVQIVVLQRYIHGKYLFYENTWGPLLAAAQKSNPVFPVTLK